MRSIFYFLVFITLVSCKKKNDPLEQEIIDLNAKEVISYWEHLYQLDQTFRGLESNDSIDNDNFRKMVLLIKHHGYPSKKEHGEKANLTPNIIFTHQTSSYVVKTYFPILHEALQQGKADTTWFLHNLYGLQKCDYSRSIIRGREIMIDDIPTIFNHVNLPLDAKPNYDLSSFDQFYQDYIDEVQQIQSGQRLGEWKNERMGHYSIFAWNNNFYIQHMYIDSSYTKPQQVHFSKMKSEFTYDNNLGFDDKFSIDTNLDLVVKIDLQNGKIKSILYKKVKAFSI